MDYKTPISFKNSNSTITLTNPMHILGTSLFELGCMDVEMLGARREVIYLLKAFKVRNAIKIKV